MKWPSDRVSLCSPKSFGMYEKAAKLEASGQKLIHLEVGRPDFDTPQHIKDATKQALDNGVVHYGEFAGNRDLREAIAARLLTHNSIHASPEEILVTNGLTHAAYAVFSAAIDPGDEVILLEPYYPQHIGKIELAGGKVVSAPLDASNGYTLDPQSIESRITGKTRMIVIVNPANPIGRVFRREELQDLADLAIKYDLLVASDEVYDLITYDNNQHISIASLPGMAERTFSMFALTKAYAMDGWRVGFVTCAQKFMPALQQITANDVTHVNVFIQHGAKAAINGPQEPFDAMLAEDDRRRRLVCDRFNAIEGIVCPRPQGTIYAFPDVRAFNKSSGQLADEILEETGIVIENGAFYGASGEGHLRVCFGSESYEVLAEAMSRIEAFFARQALRKTS